jgi:phage-related protein
MTDEDKRIPARFYQTEAGTEPVRNWLKSLDREERFLIGADIKTVEYGWPIGMPTCRPLGKGLFEVRTNLPQGRRIARVFFCIYEDQMVLLHGFIKKTQKTPQQELEVALDRKRKLEGKS